jgi:hypothetical protein
MVTLSQLEPRTPISSAPYTITQPGSYYLTANIAINFGRAIQIEANNVKLDLNGFTISSTDPSAMSYGIYIGPISQVTNVTIINGFISSGITNDGVGDFGGSGFSYGIYGNSFNVQVKNVAVYGCLNDGIGLNFNSTVVEACAVNAAGGNGIYANSVSDSTAVNCGNSGIYAYTANNCYGRGYYLGIEANAAANCYGSGVIQDGLYANGTAENCYGASSTGVGLGAVIASNCYGFSSSSYGIFVDNANNCYGTCGGSGYGLYADVVATGCFGYSPSGTGLRAFIASVCHGVTTTGTALNATYSVNSF